MSSSILGSAWITNFTGLQEGYYQNGNEIGSSSYIKTSTIPTITAPLIENTTIINGLLSGSSITPYAIYDASLYNSTYNVLPEARGQTTKNVTNTVGTITKGSYAVNTFGATASIPYISGGTGAKLIFPTGSMPSTFTIFAISRYTNVLTNKNRILTTDTAIVNSQGDWFLGHELGKVGVAKFGGSSYKTDVNGVTVSSSANWLVIGANNASSGTALNTVYSNNTANGTALGGNGGYNLGINTFAGQESEWALSYLIIYETALSATNMATVSQKLTDYLTNGSFVTPTDPTLVYHYKFNDGDINGNMLANYATGTAVYDATVSGGATIDKTTTKFGGGSLLLNNNYSAPPFIPENPQFVTLPSFATDLSGISISVWLKTSMTYEFMEVYSFNKLTASITDAILCIPKQAVLCDNGTGNSIAPPTGQLLGLTTGNWVHLVWTMAYSGSMTSSTWKLYINGVSTTYTNLRYPSVLTRPYCFLGQSSYNKTTQSTNSPFIDPYFYGNIDDFRLYKRVLSDTEVTNLYNNNTLT